MKIYYRANEQVGQHGALTEHIEWQPLTDGIPPFDVDAVIVFAGAPTNHAYEKILLRYGRPVLRVGKIGNADLGVIMEEYRAHLSHKERTNYQPIDCNFYDNFEAAIVQRRAVDLVYLDADGNPVEDTTLLHDLKTNQTEEFVQLASGEWLRLDRIVSMDGVAAGQSCSF